ncbi:MAG: hypothetical protein KatS3mg077_1571 [Candidatus Binatia bacterium]|nr:MAG: hypothetical protein KatS3mg077_1571 [Candidatus Binatia bacterium]
MADSTDALPVSQSKDTALVIFPGALGDFLVFLPTAIALAQHYERLLLAARGEWLSLIEHPRIEPISIEHPALTQLFSADFEPAPWRAAFGSVRQAYSWSGHGVSPFAANLQVATEGAARIFPFRDFRDGEHATEYYARCVGVAPAPPSSVAAFLRIHSCPLADQLRQRGPILAIHPGSGSPNKNWRGFDELVQLWKGATGGRVVAILGPAEISHRQRLATADMEFMARPLPEVAALLRAADCYLGNDSGVSHLAACLGARGVVLFGPRSDPQHWAPRSPKLRVIARSTPCTTCGPDVFCDHLVGSAEVLHVLLSEGASGMSKQT